MYDFVAQLVEHFPFKEGVLSSNLSKITKKIFLLIFTIFIFSSCSKNKSDDTVHLSGGIFSSKANLSCEYLEQTQGKEVDKAIEEYVKKFNSTQIQ